MGLTFQRVQSGTTQKAQQDAGNTSITFHGWELEWFSKLVWRRTICWVARCVASYLTAFILMKMHSGNYISRKIQGRVFI